MNTKKKTTQHKRTRTIHHKMSLQHQHMHRILHVVHHIHHAFLHCGELIAVVCFVWYMAISGFISANFTSSLASFERHNATEIAQQLTRAMQNPNQSLMSGNIISIRSMDNNVENSFTPGYCTYGAARISPDFFPFIDKKTQQRTWWGNAKDRCENAQATWYKIGLVPSQWALIVYDAGPKFGSYGHVGRVIHYDKMLNKLIVRDEAWVAIWTMSDRWQNAWDETIKCYIYNSKTTMPTIDDTINPSNISTGTVVTGVLITPPSSGIIWTNPQTSVTTTPVVVHTPVVETHPAATTSPQIITTPVVTPPSSDIIWTNLLTSSVPLSFDNLDEYGQHVVGQRFIEASLTRPTTMNIGDIATIVIMLNDRQTGDKFAGLLPLDFSFIASENNINLDYSTINLVNDGKITLHVKAVEKWSSVLIINLGDVRIGQMNFTVN